MPAVDPITFEVLKHRLWQITDEQAITIKTISSSPIVVEGNDFNVGVFTGDGRVVTAGIGSLVHVTTMGSTIQSILREAGEVRPGDVFLTNDPFLGALHQSDVVLASPLFEGGDLILWVANVLHHPDVGGIDEGSFCINARNLYQDPPRYFLKLLDAGRFSREVQRTFVGNSRLPEAVELDLRAQLGAINVAQRRLREVTEEYGVRTVLDSMEQALRLAASSLHERLTRIPDGRWETDVYMDGDRIGSKRIVRVHLALEKIGDRLRFDYTGSDPQVDAAVNSTYHATYAGSVVPVYTFICGGDIDWNDAVKDCVELVAPEGTVVNASFPAPISICTIGFRWLVTTAATDAVAQMLSASGVFRDRVCPSWGVSANCANLFGRRANGTHVGALLSDHRACGAGARSFADGISHSGQATSFSSNVANVESQEWKLPVLYIHRRQLTDSGGPGKYRGGLTAEAALAPYGADQLILKLTNTAGTDQSNAAGIDGGYPGAGSQACIVREAGVWEAFASGRLPELGKSWQGREVLESKAEALLAPDDVFILYPPAGGGYGDPLDREPAAVAEDVQFGRVSRGGAEQYYGVVLDAKDLVNADQTEHLRATRKQERLGGHTARSNGRNEQGRVVRQVGELLELVESQGSTWLHCCRCGHHVGSSLTDASASVIHRAEPLAAAGPWLAVRWQGHSPNFVLDEAICPGCGSLLRVHERRLEPVTQEPRKQWSVVGADG